MKIENLIKKIEEKELSKYELILITKKYIENNDAVITKEFFTAIENEISNLIFDFKNSLVNELTNDHQIMKFFNDFELEICELIDECIENDQSLKESSENLINSIIKVIEINTPPIFENGKFTRKPIFLEYLYIYGKVKDLQIKQQNKILNLQKIIELQKVISQPFPNFGEAQPTPVVSEEPQPENTKQSKTILINGRTPNLLERYLIADKTLNLEKALYALNVSEKERYKLLALVLGCNEDNARRVMSGTYPAKTNQKEIDNFTNKYLSE